jgi:seryl-tRNA synthetase
MIDLRDLRENPDTYKESASLRGLNADVIDAALGYDADRTALIGQVETLRASLNLKGKPSDDELEKLKKSKAHLLELESKLDKIETNLDEQLSQIPNLMAPNTPVGGEEANRTEKDWGDHREFDFKPQDHMAIAEKNKWIDFERGAKVAGSKFYFLKGSLVKLEFALTQFIINKLSAEGFEPMMVPHLVSGKVASGTGYLPRGEERQIYKIDGEDLNLIATSEMPITGFYADEILDLETLPAAFVGHSPSYRVESGSYGKYSKGLYRVHQFNKLEMYVFCLPKDSEQWHQKLLTLEEEICQALGIPYRVVRIASGDLGAPAYKKYDIEYWSPVENDYRELMSCSSVTDFQSRRLNVRYRGEDGKIHFVHTLNATAAAFSRMPIAILENHQQADGSIKVPEALVHYYGGNIL